MEIHKIIEECSLKCRQIITERMTDVQALADGLMEHETLDLKQITKILGERPYPMPPSLAEIINFKDKEELEMEKQEKTEVPVDSQKPQDNPKLELA